MHLRATLRGLAPGRAAGAMLARTVGAFPRERRFDVAIHIARALTPVLRRIPMPAGPQFTSKLDTPAATTLSLLLGMMNRRGIEFTPRVRVEGDLDGLTGPGQGVLVVAPYSKLNSIGVRFFHEHRPGTTVVTAIDRDYHGLGSRATVPRIVTKRTFMVNLRHALAGEALAFAMIETTSDARGAVCFPTAKGPMFAVDGLLRFAARVDVQLTFASVELAPEGAVRIVLGAPPRDEPRTADGDLAAYIRFVQKRVAASQ